MQQPEGQHRFSGLPVLLDGADWNDVYVYNGDFAWDNQEGFFRNNTGRDPHPWFEVCRNLPAIGGQSGDI